MEMKAVSDNHFISAQILTFTFTAIQAPLHPPVPHSHDRALLRPLSTLGKPKFSDSGVSFLRRTEYISSYTSKSRFDSTTSKSLIDNTGNRNRRPVHNIDKDSSEAIKKEVEKSFQIAANNLKNRNLVRHPTKRNVKLVDAYPLLPDHDSFPDAGGYVSIKFLTNPVPPSTTYDVRLENSLLRPVEGSEEEEAAKQAIKEAYERDPERNPPPDETIEYEFYLTEKPSEALNFKRKFDTLDPEKDDEELYPQKNGSGEGCFRFKRVRAYESAAQTGSVANKYDEEVAIAIHDGSDGLHQKGAYYYPVVQRTSIRPQRNKNIEMRRLRLNTTDDELKRATDFIDMRVEDPTEEMQTERDLFKELPWGREDEVAEEGGADVEQSRKQKESSLSPERKDEDDDQKSD
jgi:RNA polymerase II-associated factor 1